MVAKLTSKDGISGNFPQKKFKSVVEILQKEGYSVKTKKICGEISGKIPIKFGKYTPDIFAFREINDIIVVEFENCTNILSPEIESKWRLLASRSCIDLHLIVPSCCKEKVNMKNRIKNIPVTVHCINECHNSLKMAMENSK